MMEHFCLPANKFSGRNNQKKAKKEYNHGNDIIALVITIPLVMLGKQGCNGVLNSPAPRVIGKDSP